jgi:hypothetical protein
VFVFVALVALVAIVSAARIALGQDSASIW